MTASASATLHALLSGSLVWMAGPLMMTLFQGDSLPLLPHDETSIQQIAPENGAETDGVARAVGGLSATVNDLKGSMKNFIDDLVTADNRQETLVNFCWLILIIVIAKNLFLYLQGFFMAFVQQSVIRHFRDQLFEKYQRLSLAYFHRRRTGEVISRVTNDVVVLNESIDIGFNRLVTDSILVLVFSCFLLILSW